MRLQMPSVPSARAKAMLIPAALIVGLGLSSCATPGAAEPGASTKASVANFDKDLHDLLPEKVKTSGLIRAGVSTTGAPFSSKNGDQIVGIIPELATEVESILGVRIEWVEAPFAGLITAAQAGRTDMIWAAMVDTVEREKVLDFVPYVASTDSLLVMSGNPKKFGSLDDLCGHSAGTARGSVEALMLEEQKRKCAETGAALEVSLYDSQGDTQTQLRAGKIDADLGTTISMRYVASRFDGGKAFEVLPGTYPQAPFSIGIPKGNDELLRAVHGALKKVVANESYPAILKKYDAESEHLEADQVVINPAGTAAKK